MEPKNTHEAMLIELLDECLRCLGEHLESVQIIGSFVNDNGETERVTRGAGNWYARIGMAQEFLEMDAAQTTAFELSKILPPMDED